MPNKTSTDTPEFWGQLLFEARDLLDRQDAHLSSIQRQSQSIFTGLLAVTAILLTAASVYVSFRPESTSGPPESVGSDVLMSRGSPETSDLPASTTSEAPPPTNSPEASDSWSLSEALVIVMVAAAFTTVVGVNGHVWFSIQRRRVWRVSAEAFELMRFRGSMEGLVDLQRRLVGTLTEQLRDNEAIVMRAQHRVRFQAATNFAFFYLLVVGLSTFILLR